MNCSEKRGAAKLVGPSCPRKTMQEIAQISQKLKLEYSEEFSQLCNTAFFFKQWRTPFIKYYARKWSVLIRAKDLPLFRESERQFEGCVLFASIERKTSASDFRNRGKSFHQGWWYTRYHWTKSMKLDGTKVWGLVGVDENCNWT